jgi:hypothetical protein
MAVFIEAGYLDDEDRGVPRTQDVGKTAGANQCKGLG